MAKKLSLTSLLAKKAPELLTLEPGFLRRTILTIVDRILSLERMNTFFDRHPLVRGIDFIDELFNELGFSFTLSHADKARIPSEGSLIIVANHPLGGLDGLALVRAVRDVRTDVRIVANDVLLEIEPLAELFLPVDVFSGTGSRRNARAIDDALSREEAVIIFPAGEVSRMTWGTIKDGPWSGGAIFFARKHGAPVLPVHIGGRNSLLFYFLSAISRPLSTLFLPRELLMTRRTSIRIIVGGLVPSRAFEGLRTRMAARLLRRQTLALKWKQHGPFKTERVVIHPVPRHTITNQLAFARSLGSPSPGKQLFLVSAIDSPSVVREITRLREVTFRKVGEGTGHRFDSDRFDLTYQHVLAWDDRALEIAGAYRLGPGREILTSGGLEGLYTATLFEFAPEFHGIITQGIELGRSFIQRKYWNSFTLDYLWAGIAAVTRMDPAVRYLFGPVSISNAYPLMAKQAIIHFFAKWYGPRTVMVRSRNPFVIPAAANNELDGFFCGRTAREDMNKLKLRLRSMGVVIPTLYRQYAELCEEGGVEFQCAGVDQDFADCVDSFVVLDLQKLTPAKRERYTERYTGILTPQVPAV